MRFTKTKRFLSAILLAAMVIGLMPAVRANADDPKMSVNKTTFTLGEPIMVSATNVGAKDWIGIFDRGVTPRDGLPASQISYYYAYPANYSGSFNLLSGVFQRTLSSAGSYTLFLLQNDGYTELDRIDIEITEDTTPVAPFEKLGFSIDKTAEPGETITYVIGEPIVVTADTTQNGRSKVGLFKYDDRADAVSPYYWFYTDGTAHSIYDGIKSDRSGGLTNGRYKLSLLDADGAEKDKVYVTLASSLQVDKARNAHYRWDEPVMVTADIRLDGAWASLVRRGENVDKYTNWYYVTDSDPVDIRSASAGTKPVTPGRWNVVLFSGNYDVLTDLIYPIWIDRTYTSLTWNWSADYTSATAVFSGAMDLTTKDAEYTKQLTAQIEDNNTPATCEADGSRTVTATVTLADSGTGNDAIGYALQGYDAKTFTDTKTFTETALGHSWGEWTTVTPAGEHTNGLERRVCTRNANHYEERVIPATDHVHNAVHIGAFPATCTEDGVAEHWRCTECNLIFGDEAATRQLTNDDIVVPALDHDWDEGVDTTPATCEEPGVRTFTCKHDASHKRTEVIDPLDHDWDEGVETTPATCTTKGVKTFTCKRDASHQRTDVIPAKGHAWANPVFLPDSREHTLTCTNDPSHKTTEDCTFVQVDQTGNIITYECTVCGGTYTEAINGTLSTDKDEYQLGEPIMVTAGSTMNAAWVGLYGEGETPGPVLSYYWFYATKNPTACDILNQKTNHRPDLVPGNYKLIMMYNPDGADGNDYHVITEKTVTIVPQQDVTGTLTVNKTTFLTNEPIVVSSDTNGYAAWVGLYKAEDPVDGSVKSFYWIKPTAGGVNILNGTRNEDRTDFTSGAYKLVLFGDASNSKVLDTREISIDLDTTVPDAISTGKTSYGLYEPIVITATSSKSGAWVGMYKTTDTIESVYSIYWYYLSENGVDGTKDILTGRGEENGRRGEYKAGESYKLVLFYDDGETAYHVLASTTITVTDEVYRVGEITARLNGEVQTNGQTTVVDGSTPVIVNVGTEGASSGAWVGYYNKKVSIATDFSTVPSTWYYWLSEHNGEDVELGRAFDPGDYSVVVFGNQVYDDPRIAFYFSVVKKTGSETVVEPPTCTVDGVKYVVYEDGTDSYLPIPALGHAFGEWTYDEENRSHSRVCANDATHVETEACSFEAVSDEGGVTTYRCSVCGGTYTREIPSRIAGDSRFDTGIRIAEELKIRLGAEKFGSIILASALNFADALAGSYLASVKDAPILVTAETFGKGKPYEAVNEYIRNNLAEGGTVYVLGGEKAVSNKCLTGLSDLRIVRLDGATRYETNVRILEEAGVDGDEILVSTGKNFADSLSASASGRPILLVGRSLTAAQKELLATLGSRKFTILGGEAAVSADVEKELAKYGATSRLSGSNRYETSVLIAEKFFDAPAAAFLTNSDNFPDGLCGGMLAAKTGSPILLVKEGRTDAAAGLCGNAGISKAVALGGEKAVSEKTVAGVLGAAPVPEGE